MGYLITIPVTRVMVGFGYGIPHSNNRVTTPNLDDKTTRERMITEAIEIGCLGNTKRKRPPHYIMPHTSKIQFRMGKENTQYRAGLVFETVQTR